MFEFTENEHMSDPKHVGRIIEEYKRIGFTTALDDFGAGYAGLSLLADFQPDLVKIDMNIIRGITVSSARQAILSGIMTIARELKLSIIAEGIECEDELRYLQGSGIELFQGYYFAKPMTGALPTVTLPADGARAAA
jgi:EAL domain-containing protein (putative c-di-GMP-specific phosphodiesterase class I)